MTDLTFDTDNLIAEACQRTGFADFGPGDFRTPLAVLCHSLDTEAPLSPEGRLAQRERVLTSLAARLTMQDWFTRHPDIAEEDIGTPVVIVGLPLTEAGWAEMQKWRDANQREARPSHAYTLAEFGLDEPRIKADFRTYRARFIED